MGASDGGPAFPVVELDQVTGNVYAQHMGVSLRDYFAIRANEQDVENHREYAIEPKAGGRIYSMTVEQAKYAYADAMIAARETK